MSEGTKLMFFVAVLVAVTVIWISVDHRLDESRPSSMGQRAKPAMPADREARRNARRALPRDQRTRDGVVHPGDRDSIAGRGAGGRHTEQQAADPPAIPPRRGDGADQRDARVETVLGNRGNIRDNLAAADDVRPGQRGRPEQRQRSGAPPHGAPVARRAGDGSEATGGQMGDAGADGAADSAEKAPRFVPGPGDLKPFAELNGADLGQRELQGLDLQGADFTDANLSQANLQDAALEEAIFANADLTRADMRRSILSDADLSDARLSQADLRGAELSGTDLSNSNLNKTNFGGVSFQGADLSGADLSGAILFGTDFRETNLDGANFAGADLREANLRDVDISNVENLGCEQLILARGWQSAIRSADLACGGSLPGDEPEYTGVE